MKKIKLLLLITACFAVAMLVLFAFAPAQGFTVFTWLTHSKDIWLGSFGAGGVSLAVAGLAMPEQEFQAKVLSGVEQMEKETKKAFEDLTKLKNTSNDHAANIAAIKRVQAQLGNERRMAFGNPIQRILQDEEKRVRFDAAIRHVLRAPMTEAHKKALGEDSSPGSTLIHSELARDVYDVLSEFGKWNTLGVRRLGTKLTTYPIKTVRPVAKVILTEGDTIDDDANKAGTSVDLEAEVIAVLLNVSLQLLQDAEIDVTADVLNDFMQAYNERLDHLAFAADGTADATHGGMTGLFNFGTAAPAAAGNTKIEELELEDFIRCLTTVESAVLSRSAKWWLHPHSLARCLTVRDGNGRSIFQTALEAPAFGGIGSILGFPVELVSKAPSANVAGSKIATFGDPEGFVVGVRQDFNFEATDAHKWNTLQRSFRGYGRAGTKGRRALAFAVLTTAAA